MAKLYFRKYEGCGNDFIVVTKDVDSSLVRSICDRHSGIGADGVLVVNEKQNSMKVFNKDGSIGKMCGNGIRCVSRYLDDLCKQKKNEYIILSDAGKKKVKILSRSPFISSVCMGRYALEDMYIVRIGECIGCMIDISTPHFVYFCDEIKEEEMMNLFKKLTGKYNIDAVVRKDANEIQVKTYEIGVGFTPSCGTGMCAASFIGNQIKLFDSKVMCHYPYGDLCVEIRNKNEVYLSGKANFVMEGFYINEL